MKNKSIIVLRVLMTIVLILIGVGIWLIIKEENKKEEVPEPVIEQEESLDINSELVKNLPYPDMSEDCRLIDNLEKYQTGFTVESIELEEKIDTAFKALSDDDTETVPAANIRNYVKSYWGEVTNYQNLSFTRNDTTYTYNEEDDTYTIEVLDTNQEEICSVGGYTKHYIATPFKATKKGKEIVVDYVLLYYIEDVTNELEVMYHIYQDSTFTRYIGTIESADNALETAASKYQSTLEHYTFRFEEEENGYHFKESKKVNEISALEEVEESELESANFLATNDLCIDFDENHLYQNDGFVPTDLEDKERLFLAFYQANKNEQLEKEPTSSGSRKEYTFTIEEAKAIYHNYWETEDELVDFEYFGYQGTATETEYKLVIDERNQTCANTRKYVETRLDHVYQDGDKLYVDYKIRFVDKRGNLIHIYQDRNYENALQENIRSTDISEDYWDLEYATYRYVYKKQENGNFYFLEGFYI